MSDQIDPRVNEELEQEFKQALKTWLDQHPGEQPNILNARYFFFSGALASNERSRKSLSEAFK